jgi:hypothetical protein
LNADSCDLGWEPKHAQFTSTLGQGKSPLLVPVTPMTATFAPDVHARGTPYRGATVEGLVRHPLACVNNTWVLVFRHSGNCGGNREGQSLSGRTLRLKTKTTVGFEAPHRRSGVAGNYRHKTRDFFGKWNHLKRYERGKGTRGLSRVLEAPWWPPSSSPAVL